MTVDFRSWGGTDVTIRINGTYPMLYAFFGADGAVLRDPITVQIEAAIKAGAEGVAVLGLASEVGKLGRAEQRQLVEWVAHDLRGRLPFAVTVADGNVADMILSAQFAEMAGAAWLILQPPRPPITGAQLIRFFADVARAVSIPVAIQNAPEFLGIGMTPAELLALHEVQPNICVVKAESTAVGVARTRVGVLVVPPCPRLNRAPRRRGPGQTGRQPHGARVFTHH